MSLFPLLDAPRLLFASRSPHFARPDFRNPNFMLGDSASPRKFRARVDRNAVSDLRSMGLDL